MSDPNNWRWRWVDPPSDPEDDAAPVHDLQRPLLDPGPIFSDEDVDRMWAAVQAAKPVVRNAGSLGADLTPLLGVVKGIQQLVTGRDLVTGKKLGLFDRLTGVIPFFKAGGRFRKGFESVRAARDVEHANDAYKIARSSHAAREAALKTARGAPSIHNNFEVSRRTLDLFDRQDEAANALRRARESIGRTAESGKDLKRLGGWLENGDAAKTTIEFITNPSGRDDSPDETASTGPQAPQDAGTDELPAGVPEEEPAAPEATAPEAAAPEPAPEAPESPMADGPAPSTPNVGSYDNNGDGRADESRIIEDGQGRPPPPSDDEGLGPPSTGIDNNRDGWADESQPYDDDGDDDGERASRGDPTTNNNPAPDRESGHEGPGGVPHDAGTDDPPAGMPNDEPADDEPVDGVPADDEPVDGVPADDEPADGEPADDELADGEPADDEPADGEPGEAVAESAESAHSGGDDD